MRGGSQAWQLAAGNTLSVCVCVGGGGGGALPSLSPEFGDGSSQRVPCNILAHLKKESDEERWEMKQPGFWPHSPQVSIIHPFIQQIYIRR